MSSVIRADIEGLDRDLAMANEELDRLNLKHLAKKVDIETKIISMRMRKASILEAERALQPDEDRVCPDLY